MFRRGLHYVAVGTHQIGLLTINKGEALYVSTCKSGDSGLYDSICLDGLYHWWLRINVWAGTGNYYLIGPYLLSRISYASARHVSRTLYFQHDGIHVDRASRVNVEHLE
ncbi:hypothetical protein TNCV_1533021 [Trichonephila clavipes]|nr:hypothetical protein TNCV_1533021 [Trichonephila clavipes]